MSTEHNPTEKERYRRNKQADKNIPKCPTDPDVITYAYATQYERARVADDGQEVEQELLFRQLEGYKQFLCNEPGPDIQKQTWSDLQRIIHDASIYADTYLDHKSREDVADKIIENMVREQRHLPRGIAEWIVEQISDD